VKHTPLIHAKTVGGRFFCFGENQTNHGAAKPCKKAKPAGNENIPAGKGHKDDGP